MSQNLKEIIKKYAEDVHELYGNRLRTIILYGSYARGDFRQDSDIDIMILVDLAEQEIMKESRKLYDITFEYNFQYNLMIMPIVKNIEHFNKWLHAYPFYYNVKKEGVKLYAV